MEKNETNRETLLSHSLCDDENDAFVSHDSDDEGIERIIHESSFVAIREKSLFVVVGGGVVVIVREDDDECDVKRSPIVVKIIFDGIEFGEECNHEAVVFRATAKSCRSPGRSRERWDAQVPESHRAGVVKRVGLYRDVLVCADWNFVSGVERTGLFRRAYYWADNSRWWRDDSGFCPRRRPESVLDGGARVRVFSAGDWRRDVFRVGVREETF